MKCDKYMFCIERTLILIRFLKSGYTQHRSCSNAIVDILLYPVPNRKYSGSFAGKEIPSSGNSETCVSKVAISETYPVVTAAADTFSNIRPLEH